MTRTIANAELADGRSPSVALSRVITWDLRESAGRKHGCESKKAYSAGGGGARRTSSSSAGARRALAADRRVSEVLWRRAGHRAKPDLLFAIPSPERRRAPPGRMGGWRSGRVRHSVLVLQLHQGGRLGADERPVRARGRPRRRHRQSAHQQSAGRNPAARRAGTPCRSC